MSNARARRYSPIFSATVIPDNVEPLMTTTGKDYTRMSATLRRDGKPDIKRTVMAFGQPNLDIRHLLNPGQPVQLAIQMNGGSAKVIGLPREIAIEAPAAVDQIQLANEAQLEATIEEVGAILWLLDIDASLHDSIAHEMITGESERPADEDFEDLSNISSLVHILFPILNAGVDYRTACRAVDLILDLPAAAYLEDMRTFREQNSARALLAA